MMVVDGQGISLGGQLAMASPGEVTLVDSTLSAIKVSRQGRGRPRSNPERLTADKVYDADKLRKRFGERGIDVVVPHRRDRKSRNLLDGRKILRYRHRWIVERTISWLSNYWNLLVRHEREITVCRALIHIACLLITLRHV